jgi:hypothetical protein
MSSKLALLAPSALAAATMTLFAAALAPSAHAVTITRGFAGLWHDSSGANRGFSAEVVDTAAGKQLNAYWITTDAAGKPVWIIGQGAAVGNRAVLDAVTSTSSAGSARAWGQLTVSFDDCSHGTVQFAPTDTRQARGQTTIARLTDDSAQSCTGGISDDRAVSSHDGRIVQFFTNTGVAPGAHGRARFEERSDRTDFNVEVEHLPIGTYSLIVDGVERATLDVATSAEGTETEVEFRSPVEPGKILLDFDPRGKEVDIVQNGTTFLTEVFPTEAGNGGGHGGGGQGGGIQQYNLRVENGHDGPEMHARLEDRPNSIDFSVELEHVAIGSYVLNVGGSDRGTIDVVAVGGGAEGEIEFRDPPEPGHLTLDFDPRGQVVEILQNGAALVSGTFPTQPQGGGHGGGGNGGGGGGNGGGGNGGGGDDGGGGHGGGGGDDGGGGHGGGGGDDGGGDDHGGGGHGGDDPPGDDHGGGRHGGDDGVGDDHGGHGGRH